MILAWAIWAVSWFAAALWSAPATARVPWRSQRLYRVLTLIGAVLLFGVYPRRGTAVHALWHVGNQAAWGLVGVGIAGFLFAWWARLHLGRLWSATVTRKADHHVVDTGPYALVRHPIYTGMLLATVALAALRGTAIALAGASIMTFGFWIKARLEERFLREQLGAADYDAYAARVSMLVPFTRWLTR
jgi:protein-S-isoprenylcysteine O-methyltransferase Ste14